MNHTNETLMTQVRLRRMDAEIYRTVFDVIPVLAFLTDGRGIIGDANDAAAAFLNMDREALRMKPLLHFVARGDTRAFRKRVQDHVLGSFVTRLRPRHGAPCTMTMAVSYLHPSQRLVWTAMPASDASVAPDPQPVLLAAE